MYYFPNVFYKKNPPKSYFWYVYATLEKEAFKEKYDESLSRIICKIRKPETMIITKEHKDAINKKKEENIKLALALKKSGICKNIIYLKRTKKSVPEDPNIIKYYQIL